MEDNKEKEMICIFCGDTLKGDWKYCPHCKSSQDKVKCFQCKKEISIQWKYCPHCTEKLNKSEPDIFNDANNWIKSILGN